MSVLTRGTSERDVPLDSINWGDKQRCMLSAPTPVIALREKLRHDVSILSIYGHSFDSWKDLPVSSLEELSQWPGVTITAEFGHS